MNAGTWQTVTAVLGVLAAILIGVIIVMVLADPDQPVPTGSPSLVAGVSPSSPPVSSPSLATALATPTATAAATEAPAQTPPPTDAPVETVSPPPAATGAATASPTAATTSPAATAGATMTAEPSPTQGVVAPVREIRFNDVGLDAPDSPEAPSERFITFTTSGPGQVSAALSDVSAGRVRICLWRGTRTAVADQECRNARTGGLQRSVADVGDTQWTVSLIGATDQVSPSATVVVAFHSHAPRVTIERFRFQGQEIENYNGFVAEITAAATGDLHLLANWENPDDERYPYEMLVEQIGSPAAPFVAEGSVTTATEHTAPVELDESYRVTFANTTDVANTEVFLEATLTWP